MPYKVGNVREKSLREIYLNSEALKRIRDWRNFKPPCGNCEFGFMCGGSRARAFAYQRDPFGHDPACLYPSIREGIRDVIERALDLSPK